MNRQDFEKVRLVNHHAANRDAEAGFSALKDALEKAEKDGTIAVEDDRKGDPGLAARNAATAAATSDIAKLQETVARQAAQLEALAAKLAETPKSKKGR